MKEARQQAADGSLRPVCFEAWSGTLRELLDAAGFLCVPRQGPGGIFVSVLVDPQVSVLEPVATTVFEGMSPMMNLRKHLAKNKAARGGFTLIELVVVLLILAALAGILVPGFQNMLLRSHGASGAANVAEISKALQMNLAEYGAYPDRLDNMINTGAVIESGFGGDLELASAAGLTAPQLAAVEAALAEAGISNVVGSPAATADQTFFSDPLGTDIADDGTNIAVLDSTAITALGLQATGGTANRDPIAYVALGVGGSNTGIGRVMVDAPVHFPEDGDSQPATIYSRFIAVFAIPNVGAARLATVVAAHDDGISGLGDHLGEYFESRN